MLCVLLGLVALVGSAHRAFTVPPGAFGRPAADPAANPPPTAPALREALPPQLFPTAVLHPGALTLPYGPGRYRMLRFTPDGPVIDLAGQPQIVPATEGLERTRAEGYAAGRIRFPQLKGTLLTATPPSDLPTFHTRTLPPRRTLRLEGAVLADRPLRDAFALVTVVDARFLAYDHPSAHPQQRLIRLPALDAASPAPFSAALEVDPANIEPTWFVQVFHQGAEHYGPHSATASRYYQRCQEVAHQRALRAWQQQPPAEPHGLAPFFRFTPVAPPALALPETVTAALTFVVNAQGQAQEIRLTGPADPDVLELLRATVDAWRWLPRLQSGKAQPALVQTSVTLTPGRIDEPPPPPPDPA